jgi:hypothetical protein
MPTTNHAPRPFSSCLLVVGGQCRNVGKSALVVDVIKAFPNLQWTAVKITPYVDSGCPVNGPLCGCSSNEHLFATHEEVNADGGSDSSRFLAAGAQRAIWLQTREGQLEPSLGSLKEKLATATHVIIESDALMRFWKPSLFLMVLDPANPDFKRSALENLPSADAFVFRSPPGAINAALDPISIANKPQFLQPLGTPLPSALQQFLVGSISAAPAISPNDTERGISS